MKPIEYRNMNDEDLSKKLKEMKAELFNLRFSHATGQLNNPMRLNTLRKEIARVQTIIKEKEKLASQAKKA